MDPVIEQVTTPVQPIQEQAPPPQVPQEQTVGKKGISKVYVLVGLVVIALLLTGGIFAYTIFLSPKSVSKNEPALNNSYNDTQKQVQKEVQNSAATDISDTQINKDLDAIDSNIDNLDSSTTAVDQGFNDQAVNLQ